MPCPISVCRPTRARSLYLCTHTPPQLPQPRQRGQGLLQQCFRCSRTHPHRFTSCAHPPLFSHTLMVQTGRHPNELRPRFLVRYISMKLRPTPAELIGATTAFLHPNWPQRHPAKTPTHAPTAPPLTPRATTALPLRLPTTFLRLTAAAVTSKSPSDAAATAAVVGATTVATTSDLRRP